MCSKCPSAYGSNIIRPMYSKKKSSNKSSPIDNFTIKERLVIINEYYNKYPGYTLSIGPHKHFFYKMKKCKNIIIHKDFYIPLNIKSSFVNNTPNDIKHHINILNHFLSNPNRPFNHEKNGGLCTDNTYCTLENYGLVLYSNLTDEDSTILSKLRDASIGTSKWLEFTLFVSK